MDEVKEDLPTETPAKRLACAILSEIALGETGSHLRAARAFARLYLAQRFSETFTSNPPRRNRKRRSNRTDPSVH